ncbi:hypothetical protein AAFF_G00320720 [Aldrovandia affinis]|uniref:Uncharacterized protein n=1 Tax=Aldrovandia affinis TaxID=143900 RepID=A0AAD7R6W4_9TELE|nr:hypothetical protein AAFF_G00320720 [Aldrovandia affinis]
MRSDDSSKVKGLEVRKINTKGDTPVKLALKQEVEKRKGKKCKPKVRHKIVEKGEVWMKCSSCEEWEHEECTEGYDMYLCHNCD